LGGKTGPAILQPASVAATICAVVVTEPGQFACEGTLDTAFETVFELIDEVELVVFCCVALAQTKTWLFEIDESEANALDEVGAQAACAGCALRDENSNSTVKRVGLNFTAEK
jgi:hypothetical protein